MVSGEDRLVERENGRLSERGVHLCNYGDVTIYAGVKGLCDVPVWKSILLLLSNSLLMIL